YRADILLRGSGCGADDAWFYERDPQRRQYQDETDKQPERNRVTDRRQPGCSDGADQKISNRQDEICDGKSPPEAQPVGGCSSENRQEPDHAVKNAGQRSGLFSRKI